MVTASPFVADDGGIAEETKSSTNHSFPSSLFGIFRAKKPVPSGKTNSETRSQDPLLPPTNTDMDAASAIARCRELELELAKAKEPRDLHLMAKGYTPLPGSTTPPIHTARRAHTCPEKKKSLWKVPRPTDSPYPSMATANTIDAAALPVPKDLELHSTECLVMSPAGDPVIVPRMCGDVPHPYLSGYKGVDRSGDKSRPGGYYAVPWGWNRGIKQDWAVAWANTVGYSQHVGTGWGMTANAKRFKDPVKAMEYLDDNPLPPGFVSPPHPGITVPHIPGPFDAKAWHFDDDEDDVTFYDTIADDGETVFADELDCLRRTLHVAPPAKETSMPVPDTIQVTHGGQHNQAISLLRQLGLSITPANIQLVEAQLGPPTGLSEGMDDSTTGTDAKEEKDNAKLRYKMSDFPKFPKDHRDPTAYDRWRQSLYHRLHIPWWQYNGRNVCDLPSTPPDPIGESISQALLFHLTKSVHASHNPVAIGLVTTRCHGKDPHKGIELLVALDKDARQRTSAALLQDYSDWQSIAHKSREHIVTLHERLTNARDRLARNKYVISDFEFRVKLYHCIMDGPYGSYLQSLSTDLDMGRLDLLKISTDSLYSQIYELFMAKCFDNTRLLPGKSIPLARRAGAGGNDQSQSRSESTTTPETTKNVHVHDLHRKYACIFCRIPRTKAKPRPLGFHYTPGCKLAKECGLTITWDSQSDTVCPRSDQPYDPQRGRKTSSATNDKTSSDSTANRPRPPTPTNPRAWADNPDDDASQSTNSSAQSSPYSSSPVGRRVATAWCHRSSTLSPSRHHPLLCPDSGATSDMFWDRSLFTDYEKVSNEVVELGDGHPTTIQGKGTVQVVLEGHPVRLTNCLHVPQLDVHLLSIRLHRRRGPGCSFICDSSGMFLTFPSFSVEVDDTKDTLLSATPWNENDPFEYDQLHPRTSPTPTNKALRKGSRMWCRRTIHTPKQGVFARVTTRTMSKMDQHVHIAQQDTHPDPATLPTVYTTDPALSKTPRRVSSQELHKMFGNRKLPDYSIFEKIGTGIKLDLHDEPLPTVGDLVNSTKRRRGKRSKRPSKKLDLVGMDIGYGDETSPGGYKYVLSLVDSFTRHSFVYGLRGVTGRDIEEALYSFIIDAGGIPKRIRCDFDTRFVKGAALRFMKHHKIKIESSPPGRQSGNGLAESHWKSACRMARAFLIEANLPKRFWFWAIREAYHRMNMLPVITQPATAHHPAIHSTPMELFYSVKPDYRVLFPFGSVGYFHREQDGPRKRTQFESQSLAGIAVGRSEFTNGLIFYNPQLQDFCVSTDYSLDTTRSIGHAFPTLSYDGGFQLSLFNGRINGKEAYPPGSEIQTMVGGKLVKGTVIKCPTNRRQYYRVSLPNHHDTVDVNPDEVWEPNASALNDIPPWDEPLYEPPIAPSWLQPNSPVRLQTSDHIMEEGELTRDADGDWQFEGMNADPVTNLRTLIPLPDLATTWRQRLLEGTLLLGWTETADSTWKTVKQFARFVSAAELQNLIAPPTLTHVSRLCETDKKVWLKAYDEEYDGLRDLDTYEVITEEQYAYYKSKGYAAIPTMNLFVVKPDAFGNPYRAKSRIVVLGNLERKTWTRDDRYAPVLQQESARLLVSIAVDKGRKLKQGDCKNAFCQPSLPPEECTIIMPPKGCPRSKPGTYWKLKKTLYGLARSPKHWYETFSTVLDNMGFTKCGNDPCLRMYEHPVHGKLYVGIYVDDFIYVGDNDSLENKFEKELAKHLTVDFMGTVDYFLGCRYLWYHDELLGQCCHISQPGFIEQLLDKFNMSECNEVKTPYRSGMPIDRIPRDNTPKEQKADLIKRYQSFMGGMVWLSINTRPDLSVATSLLAQFQVDPSEGHWEASKYVMKYLRGTVTHGIRFCQHPEQDKLYGQIAWPVPDEENSTFGITDSCWGPQDASQPLPEGEETRLVTSQEVKSIQGGMLIRNGGPIWWKASREQLTSRSSCEAEVKAMDMTTKETCHLRHLLRDLGLTTNSPVPIYNDNKGAVQWAEHGAVTKKLRHLNIREIAVMDSVRDKEIRVFHIPGKENWADLLTKEDKDDQHFLGLQTAIVPAAPVMGGVGITVSKETRAETTKNVTTDKQGCTG